MKKLLHPVGGSTSEPCLAEIKSFPAKDAAPGEAQKCNSTATMRTFTFQDFVNFARREICLSTYGITEFGKSGYGNNSWKITLTYNSLCLVDSLKQSLSASEGTAEYPPTNEKKGAEFPLPCKD
jgi:hypothetical protein